MFYLNILSFQTVKIEENRVVVVKKTFHVCDWLKGSKQQQQQKKF